MSQLMLTQRIENRIFMMRKHKVMIDRDLAELYEVPTKVLLQAVKRNQERFPLDFIFQLSNQEVTILRSQFVTLRRGHGQHRKYLPYAFTEYGVAMLSSVLRSKRAIQVNIEIMRTFGRLRYLLAHHKDLALKLQQLENRYDHQFKIVFDAIRELMQSPKKKQRAIGFGREG